MISEIIGIFVLTFFALVGIFSLVERIFSGERAGREVTVVVTSGGKDVLEHQLHGLCRAYDRVLLLDAGIDTETAQMIRCAQRRYHGLVLEEREAFSE
jgi:hypothetical protein